MTDVPKLDELPDIEAIKARAYQRRDHFARVAAEAQTEVDAVDAYLEKLGVTTPSSTQATLRREVAERTYVAVLTALSTHGYAGLATLASETSVSAGHVATVMRVAERQGHISREIRSGRSPHRFRLTNLGMEYLTSPEAAATAVER